ncbi:hypothetical protein K432DRAFT_430713 [Lepidopterella palustris CBS 459.81]|uniref:Uncharacterized protein n=1 Tax=Lepidopterella palustris CBS 459.81 TaxID=1314670 RepID=A0A8E2J8C4_9PEZI|nr:hypothetical protein K432DRAFT_430713 [Lepidopterella palustris CBS 459.81]
MGNPTANTVWPATPVHPLVKALINRAYVLADLNQGETLATEVYAPDAVMSLMGQVRRGTEEIRTYKENDGGVITARRHEIVKAFANDAAGLDLMLLGKAEMDFCTGKTFFGEFVSRMVVDEESFKAQNPKLCLSQGWANPMPIIAAVEEARAEAGLSS